MEDVDAVVCRANKIRFLVGLEVLQISCNKIVQLNVE